MKSSKLGWALSGLLTLAGLSVGCESDGSDQASSTEAELRKKGITADGGSCECKAGKPAKDDAGTRGKSEDRGKAGANEAGVADDDQASDEDDDETGDDDADQVGDEDADESADEGAGKPDGGQGKGQTKSDKAKGGKDKAAATDCTCEDTSGGDVKGQGKSAGEEHGKSGRDGGTNAGKGQGQS